jgi:hypothetical protein
MGYSAALSRRFFAHFEQEFQANKWHYFMAGLLSAADALESGA